MSKRSTRNRNTITPKYQCPKCGLYVSPLMHPEAACERVRALYPMLLHPLAPLEKDE